MRFNIARLRCDDSTRLPRSGPGSIPARCHVWVEFVAGSRLAPRDFLRVL